MVYSSSYDVRRFVPPVCCRPKVFHTSHASVDTVSKHSVLKARSTNSGIAYEAMLSQRVLVVRKRSLMRGRQPNTTSPAGSSSCRISTQAASSPLSRNNAQHLGYIKVASAVYSFAPVPCAPFTSERRLSRIEPVRASGPKNFTSPSQILTFAWILRCPLRKKLRSSDRSRARLPAERPPVQLARACRICRAECPIVRTCPLETTAFDLAKRRRRQGCKPVGSAYTKRSNRTCSSLSRELRMHRRDASTPCHAKAARATGAPATTAATANIQDAWRRARATFGAVA